MKRQVEIDLAKELLGLHADKSAFLDDSVSSSAVEDYFSEDRFALERDRIFRKTPQPLVHSSELPEPGSFLRRDFAGLPVFFTRDDSGEAHAFLNVCRHRGTRLVDEQQGCKKRFSCPYHAWTWNNRGELIGIPHEKLGFPDVDKSQLGLRRLNCTERYGFVWVNANPDASLDIDDFMSGLAPELDWFESADHVVLHTDVLECAANWKILVEGGIEAYHFRVAHRDTIAPHFLDNLSSYQRFGMHMRTIIAKRSLLELNDQPEEDWRLRDHAQVLYSIFPTNQLLVMGDHFAWTQSQPLSASTSRLRINTVVPKDRLTTDEDLAHWAKNHEITITTLREDFAIGESIQAGLQSGANERLTFGRFEGALNAFNQCIEDHVSG